MVWTQGYQLFVWRDHPVEGLVFRKNVVGDSHQTTFTQTITPNKLKKDSSELQGNYEYEVTGPVNSLFDSLLQPKSWLSTDFPKDY